MSMEKSSSDRAIRKLADMVSCFLDRYFVLGILLFVIEYSIFLTVDFVIFDGLYLHHIPELAGFLFFGFWLAHRFHWWVTPLVYTINLFLNELLFKHTISLGGIIASAIISIPLLIGDSTERYRQRRNK